MSSDMTRPFSFSLMASMLSISLVSSLASNNGADTKGAREGGRGRGWYSHDVQYFTQS